MNITYYILVLEQINDTPVGVAKGASSAIPKYLQKKKYLETDMDVVMPPLTPKKHFVSKLINTRPSSQSSEVCIIFNLL